MCVAPLDAALEEEERGPRLPHMFAHTASTQGLRAPYIVSPLEVDTGTVKVELRSGRRTWQILLLNTETSDSCTLVPVLGSALG